jgi:hypothetical protein
MANYALIKNAVKNKKKVSKVTGMQAGQRV